jgi:hypothetical protein
MKRVAVHFNFPHVSKHQYLAAWDQLRNNGYSHPKGLISHVGAHQPDGSLFMCDIWESEEDFRAFADVWMPILQKLDIPILQPVIMPVYYIYQHKETGVISL